MWKKLRAREGFGILQVLMVAVGISLLSMVVTKILRTSNQGAKMSRDVTVFASIQAQILPINQDLPTWMSMMRTSPVTTWYNACLPFANPSPPTSFDCPAADQPAISDPKIVSAKSSPGDVIVTVPMVNLVGTQIGGAGSAPAFFDSSGTLVTGVNCLTVPVPSQCRFMATGYLIKQGTSQTANPGTVTMMVKLAQNPATIGPNDSKIAPGYLTIPLGTSWLSGSSGACTSGFVGTNGICYKAGSCTAPELMAGWNVSGTTATLNCVTFPTAKSNCPTGELMTGFTASKTGVLTPICQ